MATIKTITTLSLAVAALATSCSSGKDDDARNGQGLTPTAQQQELQASDGENVIEYMVYLKPQDLRDPYAHELYDHFNREAFVDSVFAAVYQHHAVVYDEDGNVLSIEDIKEREVSDPRYSHDKVAGIRFREAWDFDPVNKVMTKKVKSMLVGYEFVDDSTIVAIRPAFLIKF